MGYGDAVPEQRRAGRARSWLRRPAGCWLRLLPHHRGTCGRRGGGGGVLVRRRGGVGRLLCRPGRCTGRNWARHPGHGSSQAGSGVWRAENSGHAAPSVRRGLPERPAVRAVGDGRAPPSWPPPTRRTWRATGQSAARVDQTLYQIACVAPGSCYVIARPGTILVTHNGGPPGAAMSCPSACSGTKPDRPACLCRLHPGLIGRYALCPLGLLDTPASARPRLLRGLHRAAGVRRQPGTAQAACARRSSIWLDPRRRSQRTRQSVRRGWLQR